jgi:hypothetical protein
VNAWGLINMRLAGVCCSWTMGVCSEYLHVAELARSRILKEYRETCEVQDKVQGRNMSEWHCAPL